MMHFETVLVPINLSSQSNKALDYGIKLAQTFSGRTHLLHAYHWPIQITTPDQGIIASGSWTEVPDSAARKLEKALQKVMAAGIQGKTPRAEVPVAQAITQTAEKMGADLIVMGRRGLTGLKQGLLGSVVERTIRTAPCPVITVDAGEK